MKKILLSQAGACISELPGLHLDLWQVSPRRRRRRPRVDPLFCFAFYTFINSFFFLLFQSCHTHRQSGRQPHAPQPGLGWAGPSFHTLTHSHTIKLWVFFGPKSSILLLPIHRIGHSLPRIGLWKQNRSVWKAKIDELAIGLALSISEWKKKECKSRERDCFTLLSAWLWFSFFTLLLWIEKKKKRKQQQQRHKKRSPIRFVSFRSFVRFLFGSVQFDRRSVIGSGSTANQARLRSLIPECQ